MDFMQTAGPFGQDLKLMLWCCYHDLENFLNKHGLNPNIRPEDLSLQDFTALAHVSGNSI